MIFKGAKQKVLGNALESIFPDKNIITNARKQGQLTTDNNSSTFLEIDFYLSDLKLGFEYQDPHHYKTTWYTQAPPSFFQEKDDNKRVQVTERGETLIAIPCWWDETTESLIATIRTYRPDLFLDKHNGIPIPLHPPIGYFKGPEIREATELMLPSVPLAPYDPTHWWLSEKYDGIRAVFDSSEKRVYSRYGNILPVSNKAFTSLPAGLILDGELWFGRGNFEEAQNVVREEIYLNNMRFICFDFLLLDLPFEERLGIYLPLIPLQHPTVICAPHVRMKDRAHVEQFTNDHLWKFDAEGSVIRQPESLYVSGRSESLLKLKVSRDGEALVVDSEDGLIKLQLPNSLIFVADLHPRFTGDFPKTGDVVEFEYDSKMPKTGSPVNPKIVRTRGDLNWDDVLYEESSSDSGDVFSQTDQMKPRGFWVEQDLANTRALFDNFAKDLGRDPLLPSSWYDVSVRQFASKGGAYVLQHYGGSLIKALMDIYPSIGIEERNFQIVPRNFWQENENKRNFFEFFARKREFDPLDVDRWYLVSNQDIKDEKNGVSVLNTYGGSLSKALSSLFPSLKIDESKFHNTRFKFWQEMENQKEFFINFAKLQRFDPLVPENWYNTNIYSVISVRGGTSILKMYNMSIAKALILLFPHISFEENRFACTDTHWKSVTNRRIFFENIAKKNQFDPLDTHNWYHLPISHFQEGDIFVNKFYNGSYTKALMDTFPDLPFEASKFMHL
eukprot:Phypoly_transcript_03785.p1 GENE.Phypoly_transcript_03785~~Phypoly_transcript_03785.p1  ORF type:complete len:728 (+),score=112.28 Phypoly_transcript_03785:126-2309(+)